MMASGWKKREASRSEPDVDYVLKFEAVPAAYMRKKAKVPEDENQRIAVEFASLMSTIRSVGLQCTSRPGPQGSGTVYVFVSASPELLEDMYTRERAHDLLYGVTSSDNKLDSVPQERAGDAVLTRAECVISPATRVRYVHQLLTAPRPRGDHDTSSALEIAHMHGAELQVRTAPFPHLVDMMPLHDREFDSTWISAWSHVSLRSVMLGIREKELDELCFHFGEKIALYFGFLNMYFTSLMPVAVLGLVFWATGESYNVVYASLLVTWACAFVEAWRLRERKLAVRWGTTGLSNVPERRAEFRPRTVRSDPATGEREEVFEWWRRELRMLAAVPVIACLAVVLIAALTVIFAIEILAAEVYDGPWKNVVPLVPTVLFSTCVPMILATAQSIAGKLTDWENHAAVNAYETSLTVKIFGLQTLVSFGGLVLTAYVYIPYGERIMQFVFERGLLEELLRLVSQRADVHIPTKPHFRVHPDRLQAQMFALCVTAQVTNTFMETVLPITLRVLDRWRAQLSGLLRRDQGRRSEPHRVSFANDSVERAFLDRVSAEFALPAYDTFQDYAEMATQFGNITLWSVIWPLAPVMGFLNNWFELRSDALKLCVNVRRAVPQRVERIGPWLDVLGTIARLAAFTNASLLYLFREQHTRNASGVLEVRTELRSYLHPDLGACEKACNASSAYIARMLPAFLPRTSTTGALAAAFLVALLCEQVYSLVLMAVRHVLERAAWRGSAEEVVVRRQQWERRVGLVKKLQRMDGEEKTTLRHVPTVMNRDRVHPDFSFWDASHDVGLDFILSSGKVA